MLHYIVMAIYIRTEMEKMIRKKRSKNENRVQKTHKVGNKLKDNIRWNTLYLNFKFCLNFKQIGLRE